MKKNKYELAKEQLQKYADAKKEKAEQDAIMKQCKEELQFFAKENKGLMEKGRIHFDELGHIGFGSKTVVKTNNKKFSFKRFVAKYIDLVKPDYSITDFKKAALNAETAKDFERLGIKLDTIEEFKIEC